MKRLAESNITLNLDKCKFSKSEVKVLGNIVSANGISPDPEKVEGIINLPARKNIREVQLCQSSLNISPIKQSH